MSLLKYRNVWVFWNKKKSGLNRCSLLNSSIDEPCIYTFSYSFFFFLIIFWLIWLCNCIKQRPKDELVKEPDGDEGRRRRRKWWSEDLALSSSSKTKIPQPDHWSIPTTVKIGVIINRDSASVVVEWCESQCSWTRTCTTYHFFFKMRSELTANVTGSHTHKSGDNFVPEFFDYSLCDE